MPLVHFLEVFMGTFPVKKNVWKCYSLVSQNSNFDMFAIMEENIFCSIRALSIMYVIARKINARSKQYAYIQGNIHFTNLFKLVTCMPCEDGFLFPVNFDEC